MTSALDLTHSFIILVFLGSQKTYSIGLSEMSTWSKNEHDKTKLIHHNQIIYDVTGIVGNSSFDDGTSLNKVIADLHLHVSSPLYFLANDKLYDDVCWTELDIVGEIDDYDCVYSYGIIGISVLFETSDRFTEVVNLPVSPMTNETLVNLFSIQTFALNSIILLIKTNARFLDDDDKIDCHCSSKSSVLSDYLRDKLNIVGLTKSINSSIKFGLEYNEKLLDCCEIEPFNVLQFVQQAILRIELSPEKHLFSYRSFSEMLNTLVPKNRKFVRKINSNCTILIHVAVSNSADLSDDVTFRFRNLVANYVQKWSESSFGSERFILSTFPKNVTVLENYKYLKKYVSPLFLNQFKGTGLFETAHNCESKCWTKEMIKTIASGFNNIAFHNPSFETLCSVWTKCPNAKNDTIVNLANSSIIFSFKKKRNDEHGNIRMLLDNARILNIRTIYFYDIYDQPWNSSDWFFIVHLLRSKNVQIGCYVTFFQTIWLDDLYSFVIDEISERCGSLLNLATEVLCEWFVEEYANIAISRLLNQIEKARKLFTQKYSEKSFTPLISVMESDKQYLIGTSYKTDNRYTDFGNIQSTIFCDYYSKRINEYYDSIVTFANLNNWPKLLLRPVIDDKKRLGWYRNIGVRWGQKTDFPLLIRSGEDKSADILPGTYPCLQWSDTLNETGIDFLQNKYSGVTVNIDLKEKSELTKTQLETMLLFAMGRFLSVEVKAVNIKQLSMATGLLSPELLHAIMTSRNLSEINDTLVNINVPMNLEILRQLAHEYSNFSFLKNRVSVHFDEWENFLTSKNDKNVLNDFNFGIVLNNCAEEISNKLTRIKNLAFIRSIDYVVCRGRIHFLRSFNPTLMQEFLDTMLYTKTYMERFWPNDKTVKVIFRIGFVTSKDCKANEKELETFLRFLSIMNQHSIVYGIRYFFVSAFQDERADKNCPTSWWRLEDYTDLTNSSVYIDREDGNPKNDNFGEYFGRPTKPRLQLASIDDDNSSNGNNLFIIIIAAVTSIIFLLVIIFMWLNLRRTRQRYLTEKELGEFYDGNVINSDILDTDALNWLRTKFPDNMEIHKRDIEVGREIGSGQFGVVHHGTLMTRFEVAIKIPRSTGSKEIFKSALTEVKILSYIGTHTNVVTFLGACTKQIVRGKLYIVTEYCENGSLQNFLRNQQSCAGSLSVEMYQLYKFSQQIALGMAYIADKRVIHGDLSTRNIFLTFDYICKIGDFGLSRRLYEKVEEYVKQSKEPLPWRWMAPETLKNMEFTVKSDVWSYGVTLWEIFSLGVIPYPGLSWNSDFTDDLENGMRMDRAKYASSEIHERLLHCWSLNPEQRPTFEQFEEFFRDMRNHEYTEM